MIGGVEGRKAFVQRTLVVIYFFCLVDELEFRPGNPSSQYGVLDGGRGGRGDCCQCRMSLSLILSYVSCRF